MRIDVKLDGGLSRFASRLDAVPGKAKAILAEGLNAGGDVLRTQARRDLHEQTGVSKYGSILKRTGSKRAGPGSLSYVIRGMGRGMPVKEFPVQASTRSPVSATLWNARHNFGPRSFKSKVRGLLKRRVGASRLPLEGFNGPSVAKEIVKDRTAEHFASTAEGIVGPRIVMRLGRLLP